MKKIMRRTALLSVAFMFLAPGTMTAAELSGVPPEIQTTLDNLGGAGFTIRHGIDGSISVETLAGTTRYLPLIPAGISNPGAAGGEVILNPDGSVGFGRNGQAELLYVPVEDGDGIYPGFPAGFQPPAGASLPDNIALPPGFVPPTGLNIDRSLIPPLPPGQFLTEFGLTEGSDFTVGDDGAIIFQGIRFVPFLDPNGSVGIPRPGAANTFSANPDGSVSFPDGSVFAPVVLDHTNRPSFPSGFTPPSDVIMPSNVELPEGFLIPADIPLPTGMSIPQNARFASGVMLPANVRLPTGLNIPNDVIIPQQMQQHNADGSTTLLGVPDGVPLPPGATRNADGSVNVPLPPSFSNPLTGMDTQYLGAAVNEDGTMTMPNGMVIALPSSFMQGGFNPATGMMDPTMPAVLPDNTMPQPGDTGTMPPPDNTMPPPDGSGAMPPPDNTMPPPDNTMPQPGDTGTMPPPDNTMPPPA